MRPLPVGLLCGGLLVISVVADHPFVLAAAAAAALALLVASPGPRAPYLWFSGSAALFVALANPFVGVQGLTVLWQGPRIPVLDLQITQEEVVYGAAAGLRILGSALAIPAFVRLADGDRLATAVARIAPRSALIAALGARLLPVLQRDAAAIAQVARGRGVEMRRRRAAAELVAPLVAMSLDRSLTLAEAMEARGYGGGPRTRRPAPPATLRERLLLPLGAMMAALAGALAAGRAPYRYYDMLGDPMTTPGILAAGLIALLAAAAVTVVRWPR
jgi:energy-coupling factor transport system permease protein